MAKTKICRRCGKRKPVEKFSMCYKRSDKLQVWCKVCLSEAFRVWRLRNVKSSRN